MSPPQKTLKTVFARPKKRTRMLTPQEQYLALSSKKAAVKAARQQRADKEVPQAPSTLAFEALGYEDTSRRRTTKRKVPPRTHRPGPGVPSQEKKETQTKQRPKKRPSTTRKPQTADKIPNIRAKRLSSSRESNPQTSTSTSSTTESHSKLDIKFGSATAEIPHPEKIRRSSGSKPSDYSSDEDSYSDSDLDSEADSESDYDSLFESDPGSSSELYPDSGRKGVSKRGIATDDLMTHSADEDDFDVERRGERETKRMRMRQVQDAQQVRVNVLGEIIVAEPKKSFEPHFIDLNDISTKPEMRKERIDRFDKWSFSETNLFYRFLESYGPDFVMIEGFFPLRSRRNLVNKFKKEEKLNGDKVGDALKAKGRFTKLGHKELKRLRDDKLASKRVSFMTFHGL